LEATIICPVEEMGRNSVNPSMIPMITACIISIKSIPLELKGSGFRVQGSGIK
jgi:hypothetical protein